MLNINNLQKKTLKITIPIFLMMVFSFIFIPGVNAASGFIDGHVSVNLINVDETSSYYSNFQKALDYYNKNCSGQDFIISNALGNGYGDNEIDLICFDKNDFEFYLNYYDKGITSIENLEVYFKNNTGSAIKINSWWNTSNTGNWDKVNTGNSYANIGSSNDLIWYSSLPLIYSTEKDNNRFSLNSYYDKIYINDKEYSNEDIVINANESILNDINKSYTYEQDLDVTNISKVKVKFNLPIDTKNLNLSLNYSITGMNDFGIIGQPYVALKSINEDGKEQTDISNTDHVDYDTLVASACVIVNCDQYKDWKTNPFEEMLNGINEDKVDYFLNNHVSDITKWDSFREITNKIINKHYNYANHYVDDYNMTLLPDSTVNGYSLEFDTFNYNGSLHLNFTSNLDYTIEYEYMSDNEDYFTTINMKDYAALIMIPKVYDRNNEIQSSISSDIYLSGKYDIEFWESMESKNVLYKKSDYDDIVFSHYHHRLYPNTILYFIKKPVDDSNMDLYIKFDNRYYSYVVKRTLSEEVVINNPNTGEDITIGDISDLYNYGLDNKSKFTFNSFLKPIKFVFESITNFYQNYCPELVQNFFYLIFVFFVVLVLIRIFL